ncbi:MAG TPA: hypothetical protein EYP53_01145 [Candidatus Latescibacteria bacterium]|nr:hypothetical protein [Candidatus Latescibacterota bacterium]
MSRGSIRLATVFLVFFSVFLYGLNAKGGSLSPASPGTGDQEVPDAPMDSLTILLSWNTRSELDPCACPLKPSGGLSRRASIIRYERMLNSNLLLLDAGRIVDRDDFSSRLKIYENLKVLKYLGYAAVGISLFDLRFGKAFWKDVSHRSLLPLLSANLLSRTGQYSAQPFVIKQVGKFNVGVVGITGFSGFIPAEVDSTIRSDWVFLNPVEISKDVISSIREEVDIIILLSDLSGSANKHLVEVVEGIDILISSATADAFRDIWGDDVEKRFGPPQFQLRVGNTYLYNSSVLGHGGERLGKIVLKFDDGRKIVQANSGLIEIDENIENDEKVDAMLAEVRKKLNPK